MLAPISILPAEVPLAPFSTLSRSRNSPIRWVGSISRTYADAGVRSRLDDSTLWAHFSSNSSRNKEWIAERLSRARNAPLVVDLVELVDKRRPLPVPGAYLPHPRAPPPQPVFSSFRNCPGDQTSRKLRHWNASNSMRTSPQWALYALLGNSLFKGSSSKVTGLMRVSDHPPLVTCPS